MKLFLLFPILSLVVFMSCQSDDDKYNITINNHYYADTIIEDTSSFTTSIADIQIDTVNIIESPFYENAYDKLWAHRINTIEEVVPALQNFSGIEIDVFYEESEGRFDVRHDGELSGLSLHDYFKEINNAHYYYYWLDFKNLNTTNQEASYQLLYEILVEFDLLNSVIVEAVEPVALGYYADQEVFTSYWIPTVNNPYSNSNSKSAATVKHWLSEYPFTVISADYRMYPYIKKYFPTQNLHLWVKEVDVLNGDEELKDIAEMLAKDPYVKVILVTTDENFLL